LRRTRRVVITGLGVVAPNGIGKEAFWDALVAGKSGIDYITAFNPRSYPCHVAGEVKGFIPADFMSARTAKHAGRFAHLAVAAARLAVDDSKFRPQDERPGRVLTCVGNAMNGSGDVYETARLGFEKSGMAGIPQLSGVEFAAHAALGHVSKELGLRGQGMTIASACSTGLDVIQWAAAQIHENRADIVVAGSTEAPISEFCFATLCAFGSISTFNDPPLLASRPFDRRREGLVLGEGAAIFVLEELDHALDRRANIYAEIAGFGSGSEGTSSNRLGVRCDALSHAITEAITTAGITAGQIDYFNAHGNAMKDYDRVDTEAFRSVLGSKAYGVPISSIKSMIGHAMGAAGALQVAATCLTISHSVIPPTINYEFRDPECDLDYVPNEARTSRVRTALINAHAIGGTYSALVLKSPTPSD
jgi:3-oxoacyl-[acyl-carrier-protein] synthase II